ncbi:MAG: FeoA family protein [Acutalibacteraceae bacterium]|nr:FeoA family protein [Acutalibacteraceae bacterium]
MFFRNLSEINIGEKVTICDIKTEETLKRRLLDLGFIKGNEVSCVGKSALGDPRSYEIDGSVIAIRKMDAKNIVVR